MNIFAKQALTGVIKILIGGDAWTSVKDAVSAVSTTEVTGEEKRAIVFAALKDSGWKLANSLLNLAIEIAVVFAAKKITDIESKP